MDKMQEEAMRRVREMQSGNFSQKTQQKPSVDNGSANDNENKEKSVSTPERNDPLSGLFKDKEKLLILLLIMLLSQESSNTELVLALLYIII